MKESNKAWEAVLAYGLATLAVTVIAWAHALLFSHVWTWLQILVPFSFVVLGILIKYGDKSFDDGCFNQNVSKTLAVPCGLWMGALILVDPNSATIFIGLLLALLIASKYDNEAFQLGFVVAGGLALVSFINYPDNASYIGIGIVFLAAFVDEKISDWADKNEQGGWVSALLKERPVLKLAILVLCITSVLSSYLYFFAFLGFDLGYSFVEKYALWRGCRAVPI
jgi:hypothetical protein